MRKLINFLTILLFTVIGSVAIAAAIDVNPVIPACIVFVSNFMPSVPGLYLRIFTAAGGVATPFSFNMTYLPQFLSFTNVVPLTSLRIETQEEGVLHDYTAAGLVAANGFMHVGELPANIIQLRLANGEIKNRNVTISGVTSAAGAVPFFVNSEMYGSIPYIWKNIAILANNPTTIKKFAAIFIPTMATATDRAEITYNSGYVSNMAMEDLQRLSSIYQEGASICVNNLNALMDNVKITCAAATPAYALMYNI